MFDYNELNFDFDGDGIYDSHGEFYDTDGDGFIDTAAVDITGDGMPDVLYTDLNNDGVFDPAMFDNNGDGSFDTAFYDTDGDGVVDTTVMDTNGDGYFDTYHTELDTNMDGVIDTISHAVDYDQDGTIDSITSYNDYDHNGIFDQVIKSYDSDGDGQIDTSVTYLDYDGDGSEDAVFMEQFIDRDGDGRVDTYILNTDADGDNVFEAVEVYNVDAETGMIELDPLDESDIGNTAGVYIDDLEQFDPSKADMDSVSGDPAGSMKEWEFQGDTGRCALYSQKFVIEELTGEEIDIEELADLAEENGWFSEEGGTPLLNMNKVLDHYGINNEMSFHNDISEIEDCLNSGGKVIVSIDADEIWYGESDDLFTPGDGPNHAVEVIGIDHSNPDEPMVILNDSGNPNGCGSMIPLDAFLDAWEDGDCQMITCM
jgi:hypothetical protein